MVEKIDVDPDLGGRHGQDQVAERGAYLEDRRRKAETATRRSQEAEDET
jgi:hypothetical protein